MLMMVLSMNQIWTISMIQKMPVKTTMKMIKRVELSVKEEVSIATDTRDTANMDHGKRDMDHGKRDTVHGKRDTVHGKRDMANMDTAASMEVMDTAASMEDMDIDDMEATEGVMVASITNDCHSKPGSDYC